ncbi:MAG: tRNA (adenosine(37)-N6)-dimethylallyltransferase MiaA [Gemmatimonadetes bacterium]|nr:tRNA (adenosine(37)-N6)-dimethylallyltransferase MiaA [Gemmatimonadota bacterium]NNM03625.1 tRNA (adenosine(37)-N6)-dimethylallyltransferase MiaA [Gemmatimonadota bacterium]
MAAPAFLAIVGPTASGKTGLSLEVGPRIGGEIISMDSRQIYRGMDIGTGKVSLEERALLPHHGLDLRDPCERYSAGQFARDARAWIDEIRHRGRTPILVGGTGFFLKALTHPMFREPELDSVRLERLRIFLSQLSLEELSGFAQTLDPERVEIAEGGRHRATRTVEIALLTGRPLSWWHRESEPGEPPLEGLIVLLDPPRDRLYDRINRRVGQMIEEGLISEVEGLLAAGYGPEDPGMTGSGYREAVEFLEGRLTLDEATEEIRRSHRKYARRQVTWFRHQLPADIVVLDGDGMEAAAGDRIVAEWDRTVGKGTA